MLAVGPPGLGLLGLCGLPVSCEELHILPVPIL